MEAPGTLEEKEAGTSSRWLFSSRPWSPGTPGPSCASPDRKAEMKEVHATASRTIRAEPGIVYAILADYRVGHPSILPQRTFLSLEVEEGGAGAGTVFRLRMKSFGTVREMRAKVAEPKRGRGLIEA